ncbi:MAG: DNA-3-methyladenine glycosylase 2 family protein [Crenarchaeota archaeon]|nr:DNA-3-methyladenine glycosylase 2 family protein [Thermoproteota archaeon]
MVIVRAIHPCPPYMITPHLSQFSLIGKPTPCIYDPRTHSCRRLLHIDNEQIAYTVYFRGEPWKPVIKIKIYMGDPDKAVEMIKHIYNTHYKYPDIETLLKYAPKMKNLIQEYPGLRPGLTPSLWEALVKNIIGQNIGLRQALLITSRLVENLGSRVVVGDSVFYGFPGPREIREAGEERLRGYGLSWRKASYLVGAADLFIRGEITPSMLTSASRDEAIEILMGIKGVGPWTAKLTYMMYTGDLSVYLREDLSVRRGVESLGIPGDVEDSVAGLISYLAAYYYEKHVKHAGK